MVTTIAIGAISIVAVLGAFFAVPRLLAEDDSGQLYERSSDWPDIMAELEQVAQEWLSRDRNIDIGVGVVAVILLGLATGIFTGAGFIETLRLDITALGFILGIIGFSAMFATTYINARRSGISSAEATLLGGGLVGIVLILIIAVILQQA